MVTVDALFGIDRPCADLKQRQGWVATGALPVNLALQGGGSHGAFTWGVVDRLLEDGRLCFEAVSGTSAGAITAVVIADGFARGGGADAAREGLAQFWRRIAAESSKSPIQRNPINVLLGDWSLDNSPGFIWFDLVSRVASPYEFNPLNLNPLRELMENAVDFEQLRHCPVSKLFVSATNVHSGRVRVFNTAEITADVVMASACLPHLFQAIEIDGVPYWDGGYMGNPVLYPFFNACASQDVLLVQINPMYRGETPRKARDILNRMNEITFNASLVKELRAIEFITQLIDQGWLDPDDYRPIHLHRIAADAVMDAMTASSKFNTEWAFLEHLRDLGRAQAERFLTADIEHIGLRSSVDVARLLGDEPY